MEKEEDVNLNSSLPQKLELQTTWNGQRLVKHDGFWCPEMFFRSTLSFQNHFKAKHSDVILASLPKSGTTWMKALAFSIANRPVVDQSPLLASNPHTLVPFLEELQFDHHHHHHPIRIFSTHVHFKALPDSIRGSGES